MARVPLAAALLSSLLVAGCCDAPLIANVDVPITGQETDMWCWAASGQMTMNFIHPASAVTQADQANKQFGRTDCGNSPTPAACINGGWPEYEKYDFTATRTSDTALTWPQLRDEIGCAKRPFAFSWHWNGGGGHMMVVAGYAQIGGVNYVEINDPLPVGSGSQRVRPYADYVSGAGYTHWDDFYQIRYEGN